MVRVGGKNEPDEAGAGQRGVSWVWGRGLGFRVLGLKAYAKLFALPGRRQDTDMEPMSYHSLPENVAICFESFKC